MSDYSGLFESLTDTGTFSVLSGSHSPNKGGEAAKLDASIKRTNSGTATAKEEATPQYNLGIPTPPSSSSSRSASSASKHDSGAGSHANSRRSSSSVGARSATSMEDPTKQQPTSATADPVGSTQRASVSASSSRSPSATSAPVNDDPKVGEEYPHLSPPSSSRSNSVTSQPRPVSASSRSSSSSPHPSVSRSSSASLRSSAKSINDVVSPEGETKAEDEHGERSPPEATTSSTAAAAPQIEVKETVSDTPQPDGAEKQQPTASKASASPSPEKVPDVRAASHSPGSKKKSRPTAVAPLSPTAIVSPRRSPNAPTPATTNQEMVPAPPKQPLLRSVPPTCRKILVGLVPGDSDSDGEKEWRGVSEEGNNVHVSKENNHASDVEEIDKSNASHKVPHQRKGRSVSARQKYLNSVDLTFLVSAPLLSHMQRPKGQPSPALVTPRTSPRRQRSANVTPRAVADSQQNTEEPEWEVKHKEPHQAHKPRINNKSTGCTKAAKQAAQAEYLVRIHNEAQQLKQRREEKRHREEDEKRMDGEARKKVAVPSERLYPCGDIPHDRYEHYKEIAREAGEDVDVVEDPQDVQCSSPALLGGSTRAVATAKWVVTRTGGGKGDRQATKADQSTAPLSMHQQPRQNDEVFERLSTVRRHQINPYKDVQIGGRPLPAIGAEQLDELNERMYGRWVERQAKEKKVKEEKAANEAAAHPPKRVNPEEIADRMYAQPVEMRAKKLEVLQKKRDAEIKHRANTIDIGMPKVAPREVAQSVSIKALSQRQYYEPVAKKAAWRDATLKTIAEEDRKRSVSKGPIDSSRWDDIIERNVYEATAARRPAPPPEGATDAKPRPRTARM